MLLNVQSGRVVRALELDLITSKGQSLNPLCGTSKFHSMDIDKLGWCNGPLSCLPETYYS